MKRHSWCEGYLYDRLLTPLADWLIRLIVDLVPASSRTLEIGCGPGELACRMGRKCTQVTAIDISERMIAYAKRKKEDMGIGNVDFFCLPAAEIKDKVNGIVLNTFAAGKSRSRSELHGQVWKDDHSRLPSTIPQEHRSLWQQYHGSTGRSAAPQKFQKLAERGRDRWLCRSSWA